MSGSARSKGKAASRRGLRHVSPRKHGGKGASRAIEGKKSCCVQRVIESRAVGPHAPSVIDENEAVRPRVPSVSMADDCPLERESKEPHTNKLPN